MHVGGTKERPATFFDDAADFRAWLEANAGAATELWMGLRKKQVVPRGLTWEEAVTEALCFGWIDSQVQQIDDAAVRQRWTPRRAGSTWSRVNIEAVQRLRAEGRMHPSGIAAYERRREDRSAIYAYEQGEQTWPPRYEALLRADARASAFWDGATASYRKVCVHWVISAKQPATRDRRMVELVADCAALRLIKSQRYGVEPAWVARLQAQLG